jgi:hypothetical protein
MIWLEPPRWHGIGADVGRTARASRVRARSCTLHNALPTAGVEPSPGVRQGASAADPLPAPNDGSVASDPLR